MCLVHLAQPQCCGPVLRTCCPPALPPCCSLPPGGYRGYCTMGSPLFNISQKAYQDLQKIKQDNSLSKRMFDIKMQKWAIENKIGSQYRANKKVMEDLKKQTHEDLEDGVKKLKDVMKDLEKIESDQGLTRQEAYFKQRKILDKLSPREAALARCAAKVYAPAYENLPREGDCGLGPLSWMPMGLFGPFGSGAPAPGYGGVCPSGNCGYGGWPAGVPCATGHCGPGAWAPGVCPGGQCGNGWGAPAPYGFVVPGMGYFGRR
ncbi:unnamed protein product [Cylicocyclus nassatus]|uniref:SXP/RAL-2 family protein Ani s 5-like cation-binding domain-containing protein n=1 Tax=Cylicocyclus nassatus TaxID=53992 RepID=A0AA36MAW1_CYLNA|nr:unnamed protein product [Cylicocyclus nassatus]